MYRLNQQQAGEEILASFNSSVNSVLLDANVQSGKTGTYHFTIREMFETGAIGQCYILCGSHDTDLRNQCQDDVERYHQEAPYRDRIHVVFRQDFNKVRMITQRALIIVDESHLVAQKNQTLSQFLTSHGLNMAGTSD